MNKHPKTFYKILEEIRKKSKSTSDLGSSFEILSKKFLESDRGYTERFSKIWLWKEWPDHDGHDRGVDIIAEEENGICAIQCKAYDDHATITKDDVDSFIATTASNELCGHEITSRIFIHTGKDISLHAQKELNAIHCQIMTKESFNTNIDWTSYPNLKPKKFHELRPHQQNAFRDIMKALVVYDKGQVIMACGTGKTLLSLRIAEKFVPKNGIILYLVPSITLIQQSMREWAEQHKIPQRYFGVCSDKTVDDGGSISELESQVSTNTEKLKQNLRNRSSKQTVIFCTYNSIQVIADAMDGQEIDLVFCDEAHRTVQSVIDVKTESFFTKIHENDDPKKNISIKKRIYMTATPKIFESTITKKGYKQKTYDMNNEDIFGPIFHQYGFSQAVKDGVLCDYKIIIAELDDKYVDQQYLKSETDEGVKNVGKYNQCVSLWHAIKQQGKNGLMQRVLVFTNTIKHSQEFANETPNKISFEDIVNKINEEYGIDKSVKVRHVDGNTNAHDRKHNLKWLEDSEKLPNECRILSNARCLSEGIDVPALDGVVFMEPRKSKVDIIQAVGRVMRKIDSKMFGYVIIPVIVPFKNEAEILTNNSQWHHIAQVINGLCSHDYDLKSICDQAAVNKKKGTTTDDPEDPKHRLRDKIKFVTYTMDGYLVTHDRKIL